MTGSHREDSRDKMPLDLAPADGEEAAVAEGLSKVSKNAPIGGCRTHLDPRLVALDISPDPAAPVGISDFPPVFSTHGI